MVKRWLKQIVNRVETMEKLIVLAVVGVLSSACLIQAGLIASKGKNDLLEQYYHKSSTDWDNSKAEGPSHTSWSPSIANTTSSPPTTEGPVGGGVVVNGDCAIRVTGDLNDPAPLFTPAGILDWLTPTPTGIVELKNGQYIDMYCSNSFVSPFENMTKVTAQCLQGLYFLVDGIILPFHNFSCTEWPVYTARRTGRNCSGGTDLLAVGFEVQDGFLQTMDICHDEVNEVTRYVHHVLNPSSAAYQRSVARPRFIEGDFYEGKNVDQLYTKIQQNITISQILGMDASPYFNDSIDIYMARGHMAAKVDFIFGAPQMSTFFFVNVAPQWQAFNGGNWERVEDGVRKYVANNNLTTDCYTGVWGVSTLADVNGTQKELYLAFDENNNGLIPVPKIYFRVVIDRLSRKGIVLVGVNNPHASLEQIMKEYVVCEDIGDKINWIQWAKEDLYKGYSYACSVPDFLQVVRHLPLEDLETTGILGIEENNSPKATCSFRVNGDLKDPAPLYTPHGYYEWLSPNTQGVVELRQGESLDMYCTKAFVAPFENYTHVTAECLNGFNFQVQGQSYNFSDFVCSSWPTYTARRTGRNCNGGTDLLEVGFEVEGGFLQTMDVCHNELEEVTRYVHHILNPSSGSYQRSVTRPGFKPGDFYAGKNVDNLYTQVQQNNTISNILGMDASPYFEGPSIYLARGHMAAKVDFIFGSPQRATFFFVNAAPQWQAFNAGNWERVEDGVRKFVVDQNMTVDCYTGIWGIATLPDVNGIPRELYLAFDENNNGLIPVPKIYFRVVIDRATRNGIVLIGVNNPHASLEEILEDYVICEDIGHHIDWINWVKEDLVKGYSYACTVPDFIKVVRHLPLEDLQTSGVLGLPDMVTEGPETVGENSLYIQEIY
uniref:DNA/RNA non-specific endonuclease domain-containing protein n=1 Tax=Stomoxys calcitrans TaxID=35570 RepID=A0A1I8P1L8_STOCA